MDRPDPSDGRSKSGPHVESLTSKDKMEKIIDTLKNTNLSDSQTTDKALNNLIVLARDNSPVVVIEHPDCFVILRESLEKYRNDPKGTQIVISCFRLLSEISKASIDRSLLVLQEFNIDSITDIISYSNHNELMTTYQYLVQTIINALSGVHEVQHRLKEQAKSEKDKIQSVSQALSNITPKKVDDNCVNKNESHLFNIIVRLIRRSSSHIISSASRDCLLALIMSNIDYNHLNFGVKLVEQECVQNLLDIASEVDDIKNPSSMEISSITHSLVSAVLNKIYLCHDHDKVRDIFRQKVQEYLDKKLKNPDMEDKIRAAKVFTVLLAGPAEVGNSCVGQAGMIEMFIAMAGSDELAMQKAALDAIIAAASKKDKCSAFATMGEKALYKLRESNNEEIRIRALIGLSKISSVGSTDASIRPFSQDANSKFAQDCRAVISRPTPEFKLKHYAIEALAFLTFDGDVKEELVDDIQALKSLYDILTLDTSSPVVYSILNIFVNLTNSYDKQEHAPELIELAKFAQQHIPEEHPKDKRDVLERRLIKLVNTDLIPTLVNLSSTESKAVKDLLSRTLNALCEMEQSRGLIVQQGGVKLLMALAQTKETKSPEHSCLLASQGLARLGITLNPEFVFTGQRLLAVIKPLRRLLSPNCTALQNFEALMALTNIAQVSENARTHIIMDNGFSLIEALMFEDHELVRRAAVQCVVNLIREPQMISAYESENDRVKYLVILCQEEDLETVKAASGALAMLCQVSEVACEKIFTAKQWDEILLFLLSNENLELVHRAAVIVNSLIKCKNQRLAERVFESKIFELLVALTMPEISALPEAIKKLTLDCLKLGKERGLIKNIRSIQHIESLNNNNGDDDD